MSCQGGMGAVNATAIGEHEAGLALYVLAADPDSPYGGRVLTVSPTFGQITGVSIADCYASWFENVHPDDLPLMLADNQRAWEDGTGYDREVRFRSRPNADTDHGGWVWVRLVVHLLPGDPLRFQGVAIDVTRYKKAHAALEQANQALQERFLRPI